MTDKLNIYKDIFKQIKYTDLFRNEQGNIIVQFDDPSNVEFINSMTKI